MRRLTLLFSLCLFGCVEAVTVGPEEPLTALDAGVPKTIELRFLRFDVRGFEKRLTLADLRAFPRPLLEQMWLIDLPLEPLLTHALGQLTELRAEQARALTPAARNMWRLLNLTPENANLDGTNLADLLAIGRAVGLSQAQVLAELIGIGDNDRMVPIDVAVRAVLDDVVMTHPHVSTRRGTVDEAHPDGVYPVARDTVAVSLADMVDNFASLASRFGPAGEHPGFIKAAYAVIAPQESFAMTVRVGLNALPYKGLDLAHGRVASVNSTASQIASAFDFSDPTWLQIEGLSEVMRMQNLTMSIAENPAFIAGGSARDPAPLGGSAVWQTPPWQFEHLIADLSRLRAQSIAPHCNAYGPSGDVQPGFEAVRVCIDDAAWTQMLLDPSVLLQSPAPPSRYFWDILLEVAQTRLHDGGIAEGEANLEITLSDVPIGIGTQEVVDRIRANLSADPSALTGMAEALTDSTDGDADFYYYVDRGDGEDYLYFITPSDIRKEEGLPVRAYTYPKPGFFADPELQTRVSAKTEVDGDTTHEKVKVRPGAVLYLQDAQGRRYSLEVGDKPARHSLSLTLTALD